jgi:hypothetical protein
VIDVDFEPRRAHPRRLAVYGLATGGVARLDASGLRAYAACGGSPREVELTVDGARLVVLCQSGNVESIDEDSGVRLSVVPTDASTAFSGLAISAEGSQALVARGSDAVIELVLLDVATGSEILVTALPGPPPPAPFEGPGSGRIVSATPGRDAVVVTQSWSYHDGLEGGPRLYYFRTQILDFPTLTPRRQLAVPYDPQWMAISPDGARAFVGSNHPRMFGTLQDLDLSTASRQAARAFPGRTRWALHSRRSPRPCSRRRSTASRSRSGGA